MRNVLIWTEEETFDVNERLEVKNRNRKISRGPKLR
jgi:hypothetical protein